jgi:hypothetical protein
VNGWTLTVSGCSGQRQISFWPEAGFLPPAEMFA